VPYRRYGESLESVADEIRAAADAIGHGCDRVSLKSILKPGAARNALDCALWDLEAKQTGISVARRIGLAGVTPLTTAFTISLGDPARMAADAGAQKHRALLKVKVGTADDISRIMAVRAAAPDCEIVLDANEGWNEDNLAAHLEAAVAARISLIEQPLPAGQDSMLARIDRRVVICADESVHATGDLAELRDRYDAINIKLDKTGGLTEALDMKAEARRLGYRIMAGCMVGSSLAMAPAVLLAQDVDWVDLDGPLLLARDREPALAYRDSLVMPPEPGLWG
jgi:L-alanine-DL-glutamate epimerase-like enolase superfamily enzyme